MEHTLKEIAEKRGVDPSALRHAIRRGKLESIKRGRDHFVTEKAYQEYLDNLKKEGRGGTRKGKVIEED